jgi:hypothetical protein
MPDEGHAIWPQKRRWAFLKRLMTEVTSLLMQEDEASCAHPSFLLSEHSLD